MDVVTILSATAAIIKLLDALGLDEKIMAELKRAQVTLESSAADIAEVLAHLANVEKQFNGTAVMVRRRIDEASKKNPHTFKPGAAFAALLLAFGLLFGATACKGVGTVYELPENEKQVRRYGVQWPEDASRNPEHYVTVEEGGGRMVTTVPAVGERGGMLADFPEAP